MSKTAPLFNELEELALKLKLPKIGDYYDWFALPFDVFISWFKWKDNEEEKRLYFVFEPPVDTINIYYSYYYSHYYNLNPNLKKLPASAVLDIVDKVHCADIGLLGGKSYSDRSERILSPKRGIFCNLINIERFKKSPYKAIVKSGESLFYIDYSQTQIIEVLDRDLLEKLRKLKALADRGVGGEQQNARSMLNDLLRQHNIKEYEL